MPKDSPVCLKTSNQIPTTSRKETKWKTVSQQLKFGTICILAYFIILVLNLLYDVEYFHKTWDLMFYREILVA